MIVSEAVRVVIHVDPDLYARLVKAAEAAGEPLQLELRKRLASSLGVAR